MGCYISTKRKDQEQDSPVVRNHTDEGGELSHSTDGGGEPSQCSDTSGELSHGSSGGGESSQATDSQNNTGSAGPNHSDSGGAGASHSNTGGAGPSQGNGGGAVPSQTSHGGQEGHQQSGDAECSVCFDKFDVNHKRALMMPCGHVKTCVRCAVQVYQGTKLCPICRVELSSKPKAVSCKNVQMQREGRFWKCFAEGRMAMIIRREWCARVYLAMLQWGAAVDNSLAVCWRETFQLRPISSVVWEKLARTLRLAAPALEETVPETVKLMSPLPDDVVVDFIIPKLKESMSPVALAYFRTINTAWKRELDSVFALFRAQWKLIRIRDSQSEDCCIYAHVYGYQSCGVCGQLLRWTPRRSWPTDYSYDSDDIYSDDSE